MEILITDHHGWAKIYYSNNWLTSHQNGDDWCLCVLYSNLGDNVGWMGTQSFAGNNQTNGKYVTAVGYPGKLKNQYLNRGTINQTYTGYFETDALLVEGMSGGPLYLTPYDTAVGINKARYEDGHAAIQTRITSEIIDLIKANS